VTGKCVEVVGRVVRSVKYPSEEILQLTVGILHEVLEAGNYVAGREYTSVLNALTKIYLPVKVFQLYV
jgi:hypothetical protein